MFSTLLCYCKCFKENGLWALKQSWRMDPQTELVPWVNSLGKMSNFLPCRISLCMALKAVPCLKQRRWFSHERLSRRTVFQRIRQTDIDRQTIAEYLSLSWRSISSEKTAALWLSSPAPTSHCTPVFSPASRCPQFTKERGKGSSVLRDWFIYWERVMILSVWNLFEIWHFICLWEKLAPSCV